jgi:transposase-like protein
MAEGLTHMVVAGTSTRHPWAKWPKPCWESLEVASTISRLNQSLTQQFEAWWERPLQPHWRVLYLDGIHFTIGHGDQADSTMILTALAVDLEGNKEVLALRACAQEDKEGWISVLQDLRARGATRIDLIVTDGHDGLLAAVKELFSATPPQRWKVA